MLQDWQMLLPYFFFSSSTLSVADRYCKQQALLCQVAQSTKGAASQALCYVLLLKLWHRRLEACNSVLGTPPTARNLRS